MEEERARKRRKLGLEREVHVWRTVPPPPSNGGSGGYSVSHRQDLLHQAQQHLPVSCSSSSITRWRQRLQPYRRTGNKRVTKLSGFNRLLLVLYRLVYPKSTADEVRAWIFNTSPDPIVYSRMDIYRAEWEMDITRKRASTTANLALTELNLIRRRLFWTQPLPVGIFHVERQRLIDSDETGIYLSRCNRKYGKAYINVRVREPGAYGYSDKWTLILSIDSNGFKHVSLHQKAGTTAVDFANHIRTLLPRPQVGNNRVFLWDNLRAHYSIDVANMVYNAGHEIVPRPAYYPCDGPIEYAFNMLQNGLAQRQYNIHNDHDLVASIHEVIADLHGFDDLFGHCGY